MTFRGTSTAGEADRSALATDARAAIRKGGLKLAAGKHAFFVHSNLGLQVPDLIRTSMYDEHSASMNIYYPAGPYYSL